MSDGGILKIRSDAIFWREIEAHVIVLDGRTWEYLNLNRSGGVLWKQLVDGAQESDLVEHLLQIYDTERERAEQDVRAFVGLLREKQLLQL